MVQPTQGQLFISPKRNPEKQENTKTTVKVKLQPHNYPTTDHTKLIQTLQYMRKVITHSILSDKFQLRILPNANASFCTFARERQEKTTECLQHRASARHSESSFTTLYLSLRQCHNATGTASAKTLCEL